MENERGLIDFAVELQQEVISLAEAEDSEMLQADAFTRYMIDLLIDAGEMEGGFSCYHKAKSIEVSGYHLDDDGTLHLFTTFYNQLASLETVGKGEIEAKFKRLENFLQKSLEQYYSVLEEASQAFDMAEHIFANRNDILRVRLYLFTDGLSTAKTREDTKINKLPISYHIWDILRLYRYTSSGKHTEPIQVNFVEQFGSPLPCLRGGDSASDYSAYLAIIPGDILCELYASYGSRLLELNVRSYLQAKGKVNQGIRRTILDQPERFLAYNNGISATASDIELESLPGGGLGIRSLHNLQIVNGGQTTASIFYTSRKDKADISQLRVQAKISVVNQENVASLVPLISRYANSQNKVNEADFSANEPFHVKLELLSRSIWAPAVDGTQRQTRWFYERARGQYQDAVSLAGTPARQRQFKELHPKVQKFTKTDLAKFEMTWEQFPYLVSQGAQKCFVHFTSHLQKQGHSEVEQEYFQRMVARAILFHRAEKIIGELKFGGYRANIVTYTLAYIFHHTAGRIDLNRIWQQQNIGQGLCAAIETVSRYVHETIISPPDGKNVTEWCKREACWSKVRQLTIDLFVQLEKELLSPDDKTVEGLDDGERQKIAQVSRVSAETWYQLATWAKETHNLQPQQRSLANSLRRIRQAGKIPSIIQAEQGLSILYEAYRLGFKLVVSENIAD